MSITSASSVTTNDDLHKRNFEDSLIFGGNEKTDRAVADGNESTLSSSDDDQLPSLTHPMERRIVKKMDCFLVPLMAMLYFLSNLDKSNIGNAELAGLSKDLNLTGNQYGNCVTVFFATYIFFDPIGANLLKIVGPPKMMSFCLLCFGAISLGTAWAKNYAHLLVVRLLLGAFEGTIYPAINMYLTICYRREQYARRFAYVFFAACISSSFGGLISYGCSKISGSLSAWQYIYIVEGAISIGFVPFYVFGLSSKLEDSWFFTKEESEYVSARYKTMSTFNPDEKFNWSQVWLATKDLKTWVSAAALFCIDLTSFGLTVFLPIIITSMGFTSIKAQLLTVPIYFLTAITYFICAYISDRLRIRSPFIIGACLTCAIGLAIVVGSEVHGVRFFGMFILALGIYVNASMNCLWLSGNNGNYYKRATALGINLFCGSSSGLVSGQIFTAEDKPRYLKGLSICLALQVLGAILTFVQFLMYRRLNHKKEDIIKKCEDDGVPVPYNETLSDKNPEFRYMY